MVFGTMHLNHPKFVSEKAPGCVPQGLFANRLLTEPLLSPATLLHGPGEGVGLFLATPRKDMPVQVRRRAD